MAEMVPTTVSARDADDPSAETLTYSGTLACCDTFTITSTPSTTKSLVFPGA